MGRPPSTGVVRPLSGESLMRGLLDSLSDVAVLALDAGGRITEHNRAAELVLSCAAEFITGEHISRFYPATMAGAEQAESALTLAAETGRHDATLRLRRGSGSHFEGEVTTTSLLDDAGTLRGFAHVTRDITEGRQLERLLSHQSLHDALTGLPNRTLFLDRTRQALLRSSRDGRHPAVIVLDLDGFKLVNDSLGHAAGDDLLVLVAGRLEAAMRPGDTLARLGGDEFAALCEGYTDPQSAYGVAQRIVAAVGVLTRIGDYDVVVQASVGVALSTGSAVPPHELLRDADTAMYRAKRSGRGQISWFEQHMRPRALERLTAEADLRRALDQGGLRVHYQVVAEVQTGKAVALEALARLAHPTRGLLPPKDFIPLAEETGLIIPLGAEVLRAACSQASRWGTTTDGVAPFTLVNISARQAADPDLPALVERTLAATGADAASLCLEITESTLLREARSTTRSLLALRDLGVRLAIDDFGVGHSSLAYLRRFSVDVLKIDASFIGGLGIDDDAASLVEAMLAMARALGLTVIAEGVEHQRQLDVLRELECPLVQGYGLQRPQPVDRATVALRRFSLGGSLTLASPDKAPS